MAAKGSRQTPVPARIVGQPHTLWKDLPSYPGSMNRQTFFNELQRALERADVADLIGDLEDYHRFSSEVAAKGIALDDFERFGNYANVMEAHWHDPDRGLAYV